MNTCEFKILLRFTKLLSNIESDLYTLTAVCEGCYYPVLLPLGMSLYIPISCFFCKKDGVLLPVFIIMKLKICFTYLLAICISLICNVLFIAFVYSVQ